MSNQVVIPFRARFALTAILSALALAPLPVRAAPDTYSFPSPLPPVQGLTVLIAIHILGVCFGLGGATILDFWILRWLRWGGLPREIGRIFGFVSKVCTAGIVLLWLSGLGFLALYATDSPEKLANPKLWAKLTVVITLTLNGLVIHYVVLRGVLRDVGRPIFQGLSGLRTGIFLASGAVSGVSWYTAFALGVMRELNGTVAYSVLIGLWLGCITMASLGIALLWLILDGRRATDSQTLSPAQVASEEIEVAGPQIPASQIVRIRS